MATTLERASFANQPGMRVNLKLNAMGTIAVGDTLTVTTLPPYSKVMTCIVRKFLPFGSLKASVLTTAVSGILILPKGSSVA
jgi:hypothetical protein